MKIQSHVMYIVFLFLVGTLAVISLTARGLNYYLTPLEQRPFREDYASMRPSGTYSHGLGIVGSLMIIVGVTTYSTRKRVKRLWKAGKLSNWLEFHIFLCLVGPILVVYHTTFKAGGIAAISLWTMLSVVASGIIGRFLYVQIPRNMKGAELTEQEISAELDQLAAALLASPLGITLIRMIDKEFEHIPRPQFVGEAIRLFVRLEHIKRVTNRTVRQMIRGSRVDHATATALQSAAMRRTNLVQRSLVLHQAERMFYYWHVIHFPFSIIMFVTLAAHVTAAIMLGYTWSF
ncbi:MAG TPA: hypothetical protein VL633_11230 [Bacteroidota bacterium]|nr:hypothetical protein [Bacteroidota bacterium]